MTGESPSLSHSLSLTLPASLSLSIGTDADAIVERRPDSVARHWPVLVGLPMDELDASVGVIG